MLNQTGIQKTVGSAPVQILFNVQNQMSVGVKIVKEFEGAVTENGRKIVKAGTPLTGDLTDCATKFTAAAENAPVYIPTADEAVVSGKVYYTRTGSGTSESPYVYTKVASPVTSAIATYFELYQAGSADAVGILLHDVDVTDTDANCSLLIWGFVNLNRIDATTAALLTPAVQAALAGKIWFLKDN